MEPEEKLVFMHFPKTGGTTLHNLLVSQFLPEAVCKERHNQLHKLDRADLAKIRFFSGHYSYESIQKNIPGRKMLLTILREPKTRIISAYYFCRSHTWDFINNTRYCNEPWCYQLHGMNFRTAKAYSLRQFLEREELHLRNTYVDAIAGKTGSIVARILEAQARLSQFFWLGLTEEMDFSINDMLRRLNLPEVESIPKELAFEDLKNKIHFEEIEKERITPDVDRLLEDITLEDQVVYAFARATSSSRRAPMQLYPGVS